MNGVGKFMLIGDIAAGKTTLINALFDKNEVARKTQAIEFEGNGLDTPGEYFSHPRWYSALLCSAQDMNTLVYVHPADSVACRLPPGLLNVYSDQQIIGVITKTDLPDAQPEAVEALLREHGIGGDIYRVSSGDPQSLHDLRERLLGRAANAASATNIKERVA